MSYIGDFKYSKSKDSKSLRYIANWLDSVGFSRSSNKVLKNDMEYIFLKHGNELRIRKDIKGLPKDYEKYHNKISRILCEDLVSIASPYLF